MIGRYRFISEHHAVYGVTRLCRVLAVKRRQGYYEWLAAEPARQTRAADDEHLAQLIRQIQAEHRGYGSPRIAAELRRRGLRINRKRIERVMRERGLAGITRRRRRSLTKQDTKAAPAPAAYLHAERPGIDTARLFVVLKGPRRGRPLSAAGLDQILDSARQRAGLSKVTYHQLRHTCLTRLREAGMALEAVQPRPGTPASSPLASI